MVMLWRPTLMEPLRCAVPLFAATVKLMVPFPKPLARRLKRNQLGAADAIHEHIAAAVTVIVPVPPGEGKRSGRRL